MRTFTLHRVRELDEARGYNLRGRYDDFRRECEGDTPEMPHCGSMGKYSSDHHLITLRNFKWQ